MLARFLERLNEALDRWLFGMWDVDLGNLDGLTESGTDMWDLWLQRLIEDEA